MKWLILFFGIAANAAASVLVKVATTSPRTFPSLADPAAALRNWPFWLGLVLYGVTFLLYAAALAIADDEHRLRTAQINCQSVTAVELPVLRRHAARPAE